MSKVCFNRTNNFHQYFKIMNGISRHSSIRAQKERTAPENHIYEDIFPWKSKRELADYLLENIILQNGELIAVNKPYGVGICPPRNQSSSMGKPHQSIDNGCLHDVLPFIGNALGVDQLIIAKAPEKYTSGVTILATSEKVAERIQTCRRRDLASTKLTDKYLGIVVGLPRSSLSNETVYLSLVKSVDGKTTQPLLYDSKNITPPRKLITAKINCEILCTSDVGASAIVFRPSTTKWHFLRLFMAHKLTPLLGDNIHGARVKSYMGVPMAVNPFNAPSKSQVLSPSILMRLEIDREENITIPCHIHLQEVTLSAYNRDKSDLTIAAPTPNFFNWTCEKLNLQINE